VKNSALIRGTVTASSALALERSPRRRVEEGDRVSRKEERETEGVDEGRQPRNGALENGETDLLK